jgi:hypothetical protein
MYYKGINDMQPLNNRSVSAGYSRVSEAKPNLGDIINQIKQKNHISASDLHAYMGVRGVSRNNITDNMKNMTFKFRNSEEELPRFKNLIYMISIGLSNQEDDSALFGTKINVDIKAIEDFIKSTVDIPGGADTTRLALNLCCACLHESFDKQGGSLTGTAHHILAKLELLPPLSRLFTHGSKEATTFMQYLKLQIATGATDLIGFPLEIKYKIDDSQELCSNDFRGNDGDKNLGDFTKFGLKIKENSGNNPYIEVVIDKLNTLSPERKGLLKQFIFHLNYFTRKAISHRAQQRGYLSSDKTNGRSQNAGRYRVQFDLADVKNFFNNKLGIVLTTQEAFMIVGSCTTLNEHDKRINGTANLLIQKLTEDTSNVVKNESEEAYRSIQSNLSSLRSIDPRVSDFFKIYDADQVGVLNNDYEEKYMDEDNNHPQVESNAHVIAAPMPEHPADQLEILPVVNNVLGAVPPPPPPLPQVNPQGQGANIIAAAPPEPIQGQVGKPDLLSAIKARNFKLKKVGLEKMEKPALDPNSLAAKLAERFKAMNGEHDGNNVSDNEDEYE